MVRFRKNGIADFLPRTERNAPRAGSLLACGLYCDMLPLSDVIPSRTTPFVTVALSDGELEGGQSVLVERRSEQRMKHGEQLAPLIDSALRDAGIVRQDLTAIAVGVGRAVAHFHITDG